MAREFFKNLPDTSTPLTASRINGLLNGAEPMGSIVVEDITSKQLFDKTNYTKGYLVSESTGELNANASYGTTHYIPVKANVNYYQQGTNYYYSVLYDENYNFVSAISTKSFVPTQDGYIRTSFSLVDIDKVQVAVGKEETEVGKYKRYGYNSTDSMGKIVVDDISCKNKFNFDVITVPNGTVDYVNKTITVRTFANGTEQTLKQLCPDLEVGGTYALSFKTTGNSNFIHLFGTSTDWMNGTAHVITQADLDNGIVVYGNYEADVDVVISEIQIEKGSTATEYTPYKKFGYSKNESMGDIVVDDISCKNLFDKNKTIAGWINYQNNTLISDELYSTSDYIEVNPNTLYKLDLYNASHLEGGGIMQYDANKTWLGDGISETHNIMTFTTKNETKYVRFVVRNDSKDYVQFKLYKDFEGRTDIITGHECPTNEYIDGKRVYVKRINLGTLPNASNVTVATGLTMSNVNVVKITGIAKASDGATRILPYIDIWTNGNGTTIYITSDGNLNFYTNGDWSSYTGYVEIYYTKPDTSSVSTTSLEEEVV